MTFNEHVAIMVLGVPFLGMVPVEIVAIDRHACQQFLYGFPTGLWDRRKVTRRQDDTPPPAGV